MTHNFSSNQRYFSIDILRALAIIFMIQVHIFKFWSKREYPIIRNIIFFFGSMAGPFFLILAGISFFILVSKKSNDDIKKNEILIIVLKRALFILVISTLFQLIFGSYFGMQISFIIYWSVFQVIAFSMILFFYIPFFKLRVRLILYFLIFFIIYLLDIIINLYKIDILFVLVEGTFEFIPFANFFLFGLFLGDLLINLKEHQLKMLLLTSTLFGFLCLVFWFTLMYLISIQIIAFDLLYIRSIGIFLIIFSIYYYFTDLKKSKMIFRQILSRWGKLSFSIYYMHYAIVGIAIFLIPLVFNDTFLTGHIFYEYIIVLLTFLLIIEIILRIWNEFDNKFGIEWLMNILVNKSLFNKTKYKDQKEITK